MSNSSSADETVARESPAMWGAILVGFPIIGAAAGWGLLTIAGANVVLKARARASEADDKTHVTDVRAEVARLGVVVRDEKKRQFWRPSTS